MSAENDNAVVERIESIHVEGFRSLADVKLESIPNPMVLLGANGAGKSNVLLFIEMLKEMYSHRLRRFVSRRGGAEDQLFGGRKKTAQIQTRVGFRTRAGTNELSFALGHGGEDKLRFENEEFHFTPHDGHGGLNYGPYDSDVESGFFVASHSRNSDWRAKAATDFLSDCIMYQFNDTTDAAEFTSNWDIEDNYRLLGSAGNLAPILLRLRENDFPRYNLICKHIRRVLPEFEDFDLRKEYGKTILRWRGSSTKKTMGTHLTSDGSLRSFALLTLLNLPDDLLPRIVLLDEPELGLHPFAISLVSHMVKSLARKRQVIVATQSPHFVDAFGLDDVVLLEVRAGRTEARHLCQVDFSEWLDDHSTGELWWRNVLGGYP